MGWSTGTDLMGTIICSLCRHVKNDVAREHIYLDIIEAFEDHDWDGQDECLGEDKAFDNALKGLHPGWYE
jgi:hypothetical protein